MLEWPQPGAARPPKLADPVNIPTEHDEQVPEGDRDKGPQTGRLEAKQQVGSLRSNVGSAASSHFPRRPSAVLRGGGL